MEGEYNMVELIDHTEDTYWICRKTDNSIIHHGMVVIENVELGVKRSIVQSGLDILETFLDRKDWIARLLELGIEIEDE